ncbi:DUF7004 family protein [Flectobacillus roseus]|uniref:Uncharacterized protein n=1 Tax=Flectobacillus roseus TaxID=502259 RepID=A0ABT6Y2X6_9BACT|nr:hypothetical protein [Flectobacillus roseus]MDI9857910.1 hypothetical protein [Flectobacillus roseus]
MLVKELRDNKKIIFDSGRIDDWCVYIVHPDGRRVAPRDIDYFKYFSQITESYANNSVYVDFVSIYENTSSDLDNHLLSLIDEIVDQYHEDDKVLVELWFTVIYAGMVAEENKQYTRLGKRIKRLGMYQLLIERQTVEYAANFSKGKRWTELDMIMKKNGF